LKIGLNEKARRHEGWEAGKIEGKKVRRLEGWEVIRGEDKKVRRLES